MLGLSCFRMLGLWSPWEVYIEYYQSLLEAITNPQKELHVELHRRLHPEQGSLVLKIWIRGFPTRMEDSFRDQL